MRYLTLSLLNSFNSLWISALYLDNWVCISFTFPAANSISSFVSKCKSTFAKSGLNAGLLYVGALLLTSIIVGAFAVAVATAVALASDLLASV